jgi:hypothetical protein
MTRDEMRQFFEHRADAWRRLDIAALMLTHTDD